MPEHVGEMCPRNLQIMTATTHCLYACCQEMDDP